MTSDAATSTDLTTAAAYARATGSIYATVRVERRNADGTLTVLSEVSATAAGERVQS